MSSMASGSSLMAAASAFTPTGPAAELVDDGEEQLAVHLVEAVLVHLEQGAGRRGPRRR